MESYLDKKKKQIFHLNNYHGIHMLLLLDTMHCCVVGIGIGSIMDESIRKKENIKIATTNKYLLLNYLTINESN